MNKINNKFFLISFLIHIFVVIIFFLLNFSKDKINKKFLVLGVHSQIPTQAIFKPNRNTKTTNWFAKRQEQEKHLREKKAIQKKQELKKITKNKPIKRQPQKSITKNLNPIKKLTAVQKEIKTTPKKVSQKETKTIPKKVASNKLKNKIKQNTFKQDQKQNEMHFNLMGENNPELIKYQKNIQKEVTRLWKPPIGVAKGTECTIKFFVNNKGNVEHFEILKKSNILIYDLSILRVAKRFKFDKFVWGRIFTIEFRQ